MIIIPFLIMMSGFAFSSPNCGYAAHKSSVLNTTKLIISSVDLEIPKEIAELPKKDGSKECVRLEFNISSGGHAKNISIRDSTNSLEMNVAAIKALEKYEFRYFPTMNRVRYTLIFQATLDVAPPPPSSVRN